MKLVDLLAKRMAPVELYDGQVEQRNIRDSSITSAKIVDLTIQGGDIAANQITADKLASVIVLISQIIGGSASGARVVFDSTGLRVVDGSGNTVAKFPIDGTSNYYKGGADLTSGTLTAVDLLGNTDILPTATLTADNAAANPTTPPAVATAWPTSIAFSDTGGSVDDHWGGYYDAAGDAGGATATVLSTIPGGNGNYHYVAEYRASDGVRLRIVDIGATNDAFGVCRSGTSLFVPYYSVSTGKTFIAKYAQSTLTLLSTTEITSTIGFSRPAVIAMGCFFDGTNVIVVTCDSGGASGRIYLNKYTTAGVYSSTLILDATYNVNTTHALEFSGGLKLTEGAVNGGSAVYWLSVYDGTDGSIDTITAFDVSTGNHVANVDFGAAVPSGGAVDCLVHDGTQFWSAVWAGSLYKHSNWLWTTASPVYWGGYTWYDGAGTTHETKISPRTSITQPRRAFMQLTAPTIPSGGADDPDRVRFYLGNGSSDPGATHENLQTTTNIGVNTASLSTFNGAGANDPSTNNYVATTPGKILASAGQWQIMGDGTMKGFPPTGSVFAWTTATPPTNYLLCDGSAVSRTTYAALFGVIGTTFGVGDGSTTFNLPDLRGRVVVGKNAATFSSIGGTTGEETHVLTASELASHNHGGATGVSSHQVMDLTGATRALPAVGSAMAADTSHTHTIPSDGSNGAHNNLQPSLTLNFIIAT